MQGTGDVTVKKAPLVVYSLRFLFFVVSLFLYCKECLVLD